ncbi:hypothetical protein GPW67_05290 [Streptococcus thermophilus]|nr:hypothetical protein [Streptococcus thermophilus]MCE2093609.1 hypothetical protein [Streptococcus thermophilus]MCE2205713.1 hypothetical protein [Streptococcus thermophilus]MCE2207288.1 hypothetical protein [Streptococcus thermophilus]MCE2212168.1 hypothetical protein [Streptococcus thermophilus]
MDYDYFDSQAGDIFLIRPNGLHSVHPIANQSHHTDNSSFSFRYVRTISSGSS